MPVPKPNIGTTFIPRVELVIEEAQLRLRWESSPFDGSVNGQAIVGSNHRPVVCDVHRNGTIQGPDLQWRTILEVTRWPEWESELRTFIAPASSTQLAGRGTFPLPKPI